MPMALHHGFKFIEIRTAKRSGSPLLRVEDYMLLGRCNPIAGFIAATANARDAVFESFPQYVLALFKAFAVVRPAEGYGGGVLLPNKKLRHRLEVIETRA